MAGKKRGKLDVGSIVVSLTKEGGALAGKKKGKGRRCWRRAWRPDRGQVSPGRIRAGRVCGVARLASSAPG